VAKLADFGTSLPMPTRQLLTESVGTSGYTAPEVMTGEGYDLSADVFSLGVLQWETLQPFDRSRPILCVARTPRTRPRTSARGCGPLWSTVWCLLRAT
jgi:serine/threonine protein kinase